MLKKAFSIIICISIMFTAVFSAGIFALAEGAVYINEVCSGNEGTNGNLTDAVDGDGKYCDWIEIYNPNGVAINLDGWGLTDKTNNPYKTVLTGTAVAPANGYLIIYCSKTYAGEAAKPNAAINISGSGETLTLTSPDGSFIETFEVPPLEKDYTCCRFGDGAKTLAVMNPSPGKSNTADYMPPSAPVFSHETGIYPNVESFALEMQCYSDNDGIYYTTDGSDPRDDSVNTKWDAVDDFSSFGFVLESPNAFEDSAKEGYTLKKTAQYNGHYYGLYTAKVYFADAQRFCQSLGGYLAVVTDSAENDFIAAFGCDGCFIGAKYDNASGSFKWVNNELFSYAPFNIGQGTTELTNTVLAYGEASSRKLYTGAITVTNRRTDKNNLCLNAGAQEDTAVDKATVVKAATKFADGTYSGVVTKSYFVGSTYNSSSVYNNTAILSVSTDESNLFDYEKGVYTAGKLYDEFLAANPEAKNPPRNYTQTGRVSERECTIDYIDQNGKFGLSQDCGFRICGKASRGAAKKSIRLFARSSYSKGSFEYKFFDDSYNAEGKLIKKFDTLTVRSGANCATGVVYQDTYIQKLVENLKFNTQRGRMCMMFIDGEFWGVYVLQENYDDDYLQEYYGVSKDDVVSVKLSQDKDPITDAKSFHMKIEEGEDSDISYFNELISFLQSTDLSSDLNYARACDMIDVENFAQYMAAEVICGNYDFCYNNFSMFRTKSTDSGIPYADGKWRCLMFDTEFSMNLYGQAQASQGYNMLSRQLSLSGTTNGGYAALILNKLLKNAQFKEMFIREYQDIANINYDFYRARMLLLNYNAQYKAALALNAKRYKEDSYGLQYDRIMRFIYGREKNGLWQPGRKHYTAVHLKETFKLTGEAVSVTLSANDISGGMVSLNSHELNFNDFENGVFTGEYLSDYGITVSAQANEGYTFLGWAGSAVSSAQTYNITLDKPVNMQAIFVKEGEPEPDTSTIIVNTTPTTSTTVTTSVSTSPGQTTIKPTTVTTTQAPGPTVPGTTAQPITSVTKEFGTGDTVQINDASQWAAAIQQPGDGDTLVLNTDISVGEMITFSGKAVTIDINGHSINDSTATSNISFINLTEGASLRILDSKSDGTANAESDNGLNFAGTTAKGSALFKINKGSYLVVSNLRIITRSGGGEMNLIRNEGMLDMSGCYCTMLTGGIQISGNAVTNLNNTLIYSGTVMTSNSTSPQGLNQKQNSVGSRAVQWDGTVTDSTAVCNINNCELISSRNSGALSAVDVTATGACMNIINSRVLNSRGAALSLTGCTVNIRGEGSLVKRGEYANSKQNEGAVKIGANGVLNVFAGCVANSQKDDSGINLTDATASFVLKGGNLYSGSYHVTDASLGNKLAAAVRTANGGSVQLEAGSIHCTALAATAQELEFVTLADGSKVYADAECTDDRTDSYKSGGMLYIVVRQSEKPVNYGDANGDGEVNAKDVLLIRKYLAGWCPTVEATADANDDGSINAKDILLIRKYLAGIVNKLGKQP